MKLELKQLENKDLKEFKNDFQNAFQKGYEDYFGRTDEIILPESDIDKSLNKAGVVTYKAVINNEIVGGVIIVTSEKYGHLDFFYVKSEKQDKGIGKKIWSMVEELHPNIKTWETTITYFDKRNIHFYVNVLGFHIYEFLEDDGEGCCCDECCDNGMFNLRKIK